MGGGSIYLTNRLTFGVDLVIEQLIIRLAHAVCDLLRPLLTYLCRGQNEVSKAYGLMMEMVEGGAGGGENTQSTYFVLISHISCLYCLWAKKRLFRMFSAYFAFISG